MLSNMLRSNVLRNRRWRWMSAMVVGLLVGWFSYAAGQPGPETNPALERQELPPGCLQIVSQPGEPITAVVYDSKKQVLGVYHIDRASGEIELKSIRQIEWDLQMQHYNGKKPLPEDIRNGLVP